MRGSAFRGLARALAAACIAASGCGGEGAPESRPQATAPVPAEAHLVRVQDPSTGRWRAEILSQTYTVDGIYRSMQGPQSWVAFHLLKSGEPELLWITGYRAAIVGRDGETQMSQEFMCHSNLDIEGEGDREAVGLERSKRLFTLSQGQYEIRFPEGFGLPILSNEPLRLNTQVLNHNHHGELLEVRHRVSVEFVRDRELERPLKALVMTGGQVFASLEQEAACFNVRRPSEAQRPACSQPGEHALPPTSLAGLHTDRFGRRFSGHWVVEPGRHTRRSLVGRLTFLEDDTTVHYVATHLHPFAESMELRDLTAGETVYRAEAKGASRGIGLERVDYFSSEEGLPVYRDHEYELIVTYDNTTSEPQDSMAVMLVYVHDKRFDPRRMRARGAGGEAPT